MTSLPRISVLMPVRNEERYLGAALDSLCRQTFTQWELVAVDDGSSDATPAILAAAARNDSRIRVVRLDGEGLVAALNAGLPLCNAPLLARMDGDDVCHPRRFESQAGFLDAHPEIGLVASSFRHFPRTGLRRGMIDYERWQNSLENHSLISRDLFVESPFVHPGIMTRREIVAQVGGYRDCGWAEDYDLWLRMAAAGTRFARLPDPLFFWRDHPERATRTSDAYALDAMRRCKFHHLRRGFLSGVTELVIAGAGLAAAAGRRRGTGDPLAGHRPAQDRPPAARRTGAAFRGFRTGGKQDDRGNRVTRGATAVSLGGAKAGMAGRGGFHLRRVKGCVNPPSPLVGEGGDMVASQLVAGGSDGFGR